MLPFMNSRLPPNWTLLKQHLLSIYYMSVMVLSAGVTKKSKTQSLLSRHTQSNAGDKLFIGWPEVNLSSGPLDLPAVASAESSILQKEGAGLLLCVLRGPFQL